MCKIIHTDFKPENVVIGLREDEVKEIARTGQLTTTKGTDESKIQNMKVAGTWKADPRKQPEAAKEEGRVWGIDMEGLTAKEKKNLRKKLQRQRRKQNKNEEASTVNDGDETAEETKQKTAATEEVRKDGLRNGSLDRAPISGLLPGDDDDAEEQIIQKKRGPKIDESVSVKICDMGNGCWTYHHFTPEIQTRQYRSPEVIIGSDYDTSADVWSFACTIFEMITGDFLFEPRKGANYDKDDDHLAQMMELLGQMPKNMALAGKNSSRFFDKSGKLKHIKGLNYWPLKKVLTEKYKIKDKEAIALADFLMEMLTWYPEKRKTAQQMLSHPWLTMETNLDYRLTDKEYEVMMLKRQFKDQLGGKKEPEEAEPA